MKVPFFRFGSIGLEYLFFQLQAGVCEKYRSGYRYYRYDSALYNDTLSADTEWNGKSIGCATNTEIVFLVSLRRQ